MKQLVTVMIEQCYGVALCVLTVLLFLFLNRKYRRKEASLFYLLSFQVLLLSFAGTVERFLGEWKYDLSLYQVRNILRCLYNITAPAILLTFLEIPLREEKKWVKWGVALPEFLYILLVMTSFFRGTSGLHNNGYSGAEFIPVQYIMLLYLLIMMAFILCRSRKRKREFIILLLISSILMLNGINEMFRLLPVHTSEITIAVSMLAYLLYFSSKQHLNEVDKISHDYADNEAKHEKELVDQSIETLCQSIGIAGYDSLSGKNESGSTISVVRANRDCFCCRRWKSQWKAL